MADITTIDKEVKAILEMPGVNKENIRSRLVPPLQTGIDIDIIQLIVILNKRGEKELIRHRDIDTGA